MHQNLFGVTHLISKFFENFKNWGFCGFNFFFFSNRNPSCIPQSNLALQKDTTVVICLMTVTKIVIKLGTTHLTGVSNRNSGLTIWSWSVNFIKGCQKQQHAVCILSLINQTTLYSFPWFLTLLIFNSFKIISQNLFALSLCLFPEILQTLTILFCKSKVRKLSKPLY